MAILKDVSGDTFAEDTDCDKRLRNLDFVNDTDSGTHKMKRIRSTADVVSEAIQRFDTSVSLSKSGSFSSSANNHKSDLNSSSNNKAAKCLSLVNQQRQRHLSTKKSRKNSSKPGGTSGSASLSSGYTPILPAAPSDIDLYLNSGSNVSPDSGIQSEGPSGLTNASPPQIIQSSSSSGSGSTELVSTTPQQSFQISPGSATTVYQWPAQNGYYSGSIPGDNWAMATTNSGYILNNAGAALIVTPLQPPEVNHTSSEISPPTILPSTASQTSLATSSVPYIHHHPEQAREVRPLKRGRGRPKGSKNKKKKVMMDCETQTIDLESKMSSMSSSPYSVIDEEDQPPPPAMFMGGEDDLASRGGTLKDPPRLEPQIDPPLKLKDKEVIILESEDDDHSTIMFSDGEDDLEDDVSRNETIPELPKEQPPPVLDKVTEIPVKVKKKKKKKYKSENESNSNSNYSSLPSKSKKKRKKRSRERSREHSPPPPVLEPIQVQCEASEFENVSVKISPVVSPAKVSPVISPNALSPNLIVEEQEHHEEISDHPPEKEDTLENEVDPAEPQSPPETEPAKDDVPPGFEKKPVFDAKFRTVIVEEFWKKKKSKKCQQVQIPPQPPLVPKKQLESSSQPKINTKAAVKEIVNIPLMTSSTTPSTRTMLAVLKSTNVRSKPGRKKKGKSATSSVLTKKKLDEASSSNTSDRDGDSVCSKSPAFSPRSVASSTDENESKKKKSKNMKQSLIELGWRSKHKNVVDPIFLGQLEELLQEMASVQIDSQMSKDIWPDRPSSSMPSIFRKRKIILANTSKATFDKKKGRSKKNDKEAEHRLPLKKRQLHHQQNDEDCSVSVSSKKSVGTSEKKSNSGRSSRKSSIDDQKKVNGMTPKEARKQNFTALITDNKKQNNTEGAKKSNCVKSIPEVPSDGKRSQSATTSESQDGKKSNTLNESKRSSLQTTSSLPKKSSSAISDTLSKKQKLPASTDMPSEKYLAPSTGRSPIKAISIVDTIAACVDKYTSNNGKQCKKDFSQPLSVVTSEPKIHSSSDAVKSIGSPRKRHLLKMQNQGDLAPPTLEKVEGNRAPSNVKNHASHRQTEETKRPSSPPKLSRFDEKPSETLTSPISEDDTPRPNIYKPKVSDISEDDASDLDKAISPKPVVPCIPRILKQSNKNALMNCSVRVKKLASPKVYPEVPKLNEFKKSEKSQGKKSEQEHGRDSNPSVSKVIEKSTSEVIEKPLNKVPEKSTQKIDKKRSSIKEDEKASKQEAKKKSFKDSVAIKSNKDAKECQEQPQITEAMESPKIPEQSTAVEQSSASEHKVKEKKKKKRRANKTGFPVIKKKKKSSTVDESKAGPKPKIAKKIDKNNKQLPIRASARIIAEKIQSDSDSRPSSRNENIKRSNCPIAEEQEQSPVLPLKRSNCSINEEPEQSPILPSKRSKLYDDVDESIDCMAVLPLNGMTEEDSTLSQTDQYAPQNTGKKRRKGLHLEKKNYLIAGLFSNFYKEDQTKPLAPPIPITKVIYDADEHIHGLLPKPYYCGRQLRQQKEDFALPYDLFWQHMNKQLPGRDIAPTWNYKKIKTNVYYDVAKPMSKGFDMQACPCSLPSNSQQGNII